MKISDIIRHTQRILPLYSDLFSDVISVTSLTRDGSTVTLSTEAPHGVEAGEVFILEGAMLPNPIVELTQEGGLGRLVTQFSHDVTKNYPLRPNDSTHISIEGAIESDYNGMFLIMDIPNSNVVEFSIEADAPAQATGSPILKENSVANFNGRRACGTVIDDNTITFEIEDAPLQETATGSIKIRTGIRISGDFSFQHAQASYEAQEDGKLWGYLVFDGVDVSKSRTTQSDAIATHASGSDLRMDGVQGLNFYVFVPTSSEYCWIDFVDLADYLRKAVLKTLHLAKFKNQLSDDESKLVYVGDMPADLNTRAYAVYVFKFQSVLKISNEDGVEAEYTRALRGFTTQDVQNTGSEEFITSYGDLPNEEISID